MKNNEIVNRYKEIAAILKDLKKEQDSLKEKMKKKGSFNTKDYVVTVKEQTIRTLSLVKIEKQAPSIFKELENNNLVNISTTKRVSIKKKVA